MNSFVQIIIELIVFTIVTLSVTVAVRTVFGIMDVRRRLNDDVTVSHSPTSVVRSEQITNPVLRWVQSATSTKDSKDGQQLRRKLFLAGFEQPSAPIWYSIVRFGLAIGLPILFLLAQKLSPHPLTSVPVLILFSLFLSGLGFAVPHVLVSGRASSRSEQMENEFPDALDLMVVCVEAGLGLEAAFIRVAQEIGASHPLIAESFNRMSDELRAGRSRADALRSMADRTDVEPVRSFVALLIQTDALGTSIGQTLRTYANEMREHRFLKAEEKAMRIPVLMTVPLVACILPVIVGALLLPPVIDVMRNLVPALTGHH